MEHADGPDNDGDPRNHAMQRRSLCQCRRGSATSDRVRVVGCRGSKCERGDTVTEYDNVSNRFVE